MDAKRFARLTERQRECLRLYHHRLEAKEIARALGLSNNTIENHLSRGAAALGTDRPSAAAALVRAEATGTQPVGRFSASDPELLALAPLAHVGQDERPTLTAIWSALFPLRHGATQNDLSIYDRLLPIPFIAAAMGAALGFGALAIFLLGRALHQ